MARAHGLARLGATGDVDDLAGRVQPVDLACDRRLPVLPAFDALLPASGLRRGTTVTVEAAPGVAGASSLALALAAGASQAGSWVAAVGLGSLGLVAAAELGVALDRLVLVADPGRDRAGWGPVVAAMVDGFDIVLVATARRGGMGAGDARRLVARVRERGSVLVGVGGDLPGRRSALRLTVTSASWQGLGQGSGHLQGRRVTVEAGGRGDAARGRRAELWLPRPGTEARPGEPVRPGAAVEPADPEEPVRLVEVSAEGDSRRADLPTPRLRPARRPPPVQVQAPA